MKHCKKLLALVLVVASLLSITLVANAATVQYTDARKITHAAAVDVLSAVGVINGYENGSFKPAVDVTRAEMAKILAFVLNGGEDVGESYVSACTFADSQNHWAKGYIGYCVSAGLINGKNANTFDPEGKVTGYEVSKMLLCALGYKADLNGLTGANWNTTAHSLAIKNDLLAYLDKYKPAEELNREDSCQMILNALQATMVETTGSIVDIAGVTIAQDVASTPLAQTGVDYAGRTDEDLVAAGNQSYQQLVEEVFPTLRLVTGTTNDAFGRPATEWRLKGATLGVYPMKALTTTDTTMKASTISAAIGGATINSAEVFMNGASLGTVTVDELVSLTGFTLAKIKSQAYKNTAAAIYNYYGDNLTSSKNFPASLLAQVLIGHDETITYSANGSDNGTSCTTYTYHSEAFFDEVTGKVTLINNSYFYGKITSLRNPVLDAEGNVTSPGYVLVSTIPGNSFTPPSPYADIKVDDVTTISGGSLLPILLDDISSIGEDGEEDDSAVIKVGDYVVYNLGCTDRNAQNKTYVAENPRLCKRITVTADRVVRTSKDGTLRTYNTVYGTNGGTYYPAHKNGTRDLHQPGVTYDFVVAIFGSRYYVYRTLASTSEYLYLYNAAENTTVLPAAYEAKLINTSGETQIVQTDKLYRDQVGAIVTASKNNLGQTVLTVVGDYSGNYNVNINVENSNSNVTFDNANQLAGTSTRFIVSQIDSNGTETFTAYTGIHKVPTIRSAQYYAYVNGENGILDTVYILNASGVASTVQEGVVFKVGSKDAAITTETGTYYELPAVMNGQITTVKVTDTAYNNLQGNGFHLFTTYTTNAYGCVDSFTKLSGKAINSYAPADAGNITINGTAMTYHSNVLVYTYSLATNTLAASTVEALYELDFGTFASYYTLHENLANKPLAAIFAIIP